MIVSAPLILDDNLLIGRVEVGSTDDVLVLAPTGEVRKRTLGSMAFGSTSDYEHSLGSPELDGYVLSSTSLGVRSWVPLSGSSGTVTSVSMTVPVGLSVSGTPITNSGTLAVSLSAGYSIPTIASQGNWNTAFGWGNHATNGYLTGITQAMVNSALGYTAYSSTNPAGYITSITSTNVTIALGFTPYNSTNPSGFITGITSGMVTTALGYTPVSGTPWTSLGYITGYTETDTLASVTGRGATTTTAINITDTTQASLYNVGAIKTSGGIAAVKNIYAGGVIYGTGFMSTHSSLPYFNFGDSGQYGSLQYDISLSKIIFKVSSTEVIRFNTGAIELTKPVTVSGSLSASNFSGSSSGTNTGDQTIPTTLPASDVYSWAKSSSKPGYAWSEISSKPTSLSSFTNDLGNYGGWITGYSETDTLQSVMTRGNATGTTLTSSSTVPFAFIGNTNTGTYNQTQIYVNQNNTSGNTSNGIVIERGRLADNSSAEIRYFTIAARGGQVQWQVNGAGGTWQSGTISASNFSGSSSGTNTGDQSIPTSLPASDVYSWAKASSKPGYSWTEISSRPTALSQFSNDLGNYGGFVTGTPWTGYGYLTGTPWTAYGYITLQNAGISGAPTSGNLMLDGVQGSGVVLKDESSGTRWQLHSHGDRLRTYNGSTELIFVATADLGSMAYASTGSYYSSGNPSGFITSSGSCNYSSSTGSVAWGNVSSKPTTLSGYGISDWVWGNYGDIGNVPGVSGCYYFAGSSPIPGQSDGTVWYHAYPAAPTTWGSQLVQNYRDGRIYVRGRNSGSWSTWWTVIDSGNIGSQSVSYASSAGNADTVDGWHRDDLRAYSNLTGQPTALSQFTNNLGNYGGWADSGHSHSGYMNIAANRLYDNYTGDAMYNYNGRIYNGWLNDTVAVNYSNSTGYVTWGNVNGRPGSLSQFSNDLGNYGGWITSGGSCSYSSSSGNADTVDGQNFAWSNRNNNPTYLWGVDNNGDSYLAWRAGMSVSYADSAGSAGSATNCTNARYYYDEYRGGYRGSSDLYVSYAYNSGYASSSGYAGSSGSISGYNNPSTGADANTIAYRDGSGYLTAVQFYGTSTKTAKHDIKVLENFDAIKYNNSIVINTYLWNGSNEFGLGFIAEDTHWWLSGKKKKGHNINHHVGILTLALQQVDAKIGNKYAKLEKEIEELKKQLKQFKDGRN
jgi:hypothetical protein